MAGTIFARELAPARAGRVEFTVATRADDADLRRLLRENPMAGAVRLSLEREPDFFAGFGGAEQQTIVARERGRVACAGWCVFRERFVNGVPRRVGYLGGLRLAGEFAGRGEVVRRGYEFFGELQRERPAAGYFTSIAADNGRAQRLLERGLPGWPRYAWLAEFVTVLVPVPGSRSREEVARAGNPPANVRWQKGTAGVSPRVGTGGETPPELAGEDACGTPVAALAGSPPPHVGGYGEGGGCEGWVEFVNERARGQQLAPQWRAEEFRTLATQGLDGQPVVVGGAAGVRALGVLWDQRGCKQVVVRGYDGALALGRPVVNVAARLCGWPGLPAVGEPVALAFGAALAVAAEDAGALVELVRGLRARAAARGGAWLGLGFDARDPRLATVRRHFRRREYRSRLYAVSWPGMASVESWADGLFSPEVALL